MQRMRASRSGDFAHVSGGRLSPLMRLVGRRDAQPMSAFNIANLRDLVGGWSCLTFAIGLARGSGRLGLR